MAESLQSLWDRESRKYGNRTLSGETSYLRRDFFPACNDRILDAGCGGGDYLKLFSTVAKDLQGIDISPKMVESARRFAKCEIGDITNLPFSNESFTYVLSNFVINHCGNSSQALSELSRVLAPNGNLVLLLPHVYSVLSWERRFMILLGKYSLGACEHYSLSDLQRRLNEAGLQLTGSYLLTRKPVCDSFFRQAFALPAYLLDRWGNRCFPGFWGECVVIRAVKNSQKVGDSNGTDL